MKSLTSSEFESRKKETLDPKMAFKGISYGVLIINFLLLSDALSYPQSGQDFGIPRYFQGSFQDYQLNPFESIGITGRSSMEQEAYILKCLESYLDLPIVPFSHSFNYEYSRCKRRALKNEKEIPNEIAKLENEEIRYRKCEQKCQMFFDFSFHVGLQFQERLQMYTECEARCKENAHKFNTF